MLIAVKGNCTIIYMCFHGDSHGAAKAASTEAKKLLTLIVTFNDLSSVT